MKKSKSDYFGGPARFRKKPVVVEAVEWWGFGLRHVNGVLEWIYGHTDQSGMTFNSALGTLEISTLEGVLTAQPGDWIIRGVKGEFYPCKPDIFEATYERIGDEGRVR